MGFSQRTALGTTGGGGDRPLGAQACPEANGHDVEALALEHFSGVGVVLGRDAEQLVELAQRLFEDVDGRGGTPMRARRRPFAGEGDMEPDRRIRALLSKHGDRLLQARGDDHERDVADGAAQGRFQDA